jgi:hypothetical protein
VAMVAGLCLAQPAMTNPPDSNKTCKILMAGVK